MSDNRKSVAQEAPEVSPMTELANAIVSAMQGNNAQLADAIVKATQAAAPPRQLTFDEYVPKSPFNPTGIKNRELPFTVYQNNVPLHPDTLHDEELALLKHLQPGKFVNGLVRIIERERGGERVLFIEHPGHKHEKFLELKAECKSFTELLKRCVNEAKSLTPAA